MRTIMHYIFSSDTDTEMQKPQRGTEKKYNTEVKEKGRLPLLPRCNPPCPPWILHLPICFMLIIGFPSSSAFAHKDEKHDDEKPVQTDMTIRTPDTVTITNSDAVVLAHQHANNADVTASFGDFPTLHPLVVHFPIVLLLLAPLFQIISLFFCQSRFAANGIACMRDAWIYWRVGCRQSGSSAYGRAA